ncbi:hypothetical protein I203_100495 [Kwoniella mangroviensis CBS 8507]|uniref:uncharacterized protein n=1 Tax=Kwoniella mangroviensis CBS 8507 TaxID=1296122 RepID=UPI00306F4A63
MLDTLPVIEKVVDTSPSSFTSISTDHERSPWPTDLTESAEGIQPEVSTTRPQPLSENDLAVRLKQAAERRIDDQGDRFALPQFRQLSMDSEWAQELANTLSASQRRLTDAETMGDSARALRDRLTQIFEYQAKIKESMQVGGFTENLPEEALNLIRSGKNGILKGYIVAIPDDSKTKGGTLTLSEILGGNNSSSRHPLAIELMNYASTDAHKGQKTSVREIILSLAHDHELTDFRAECIDAIDYSIDKDMASELQSLADDIKRATKHLDERLGESLRTAIKENRPDSVADTLNYVSSNVRSLRRVDCSALKSVGYNLIELSKLFQTLQDRAKDMGIKE